jgi:hypothetical protein
MSSDPRARKATARQAVASSAGGAAPVAIRGPLPDTPAWAGTETHTGMQSWSAPDAPPSAVGGMTVIREIGRGGMGWVLEVEDPKLRRRVAVKLMLPGMAADPVCRARFLREARAQAAVEHENVAIIHAVHDEADPPYILMPLLKGRSLSERLTAAGGPLPVADVMRIGSQMASGLAAAHASGLIHRDVKPSNVWLEGEKGRVKLLDFGLARSTSGADTAGLTRPGDMIGTPAYMAPEQAHGQPIDHRADLFSLGCVMYEMATGRRPFTGDSLGAVIISLISVTPPPARSVNPALPSALSHLIHQLLEKSPDRRTPDTAAGVVARLKQIATELAVKSAAGRQPAPKVEASRSAWRVPVPAAPAPNPWRWVGYSATAAAAVGVFAGLVALGVAVGRSGPPVTQAPAPPMEDRTPPAPPPAEERKPEPVKEPAKEPEKVPAPVAPQPVIAPAPQPPKADDTPPKGWPFTQAQAEDEQLKWADKLNLGVREDIPLGDGVTLVLRLIPPGEYLAGGGEDKGQPGKKVVIRQPFYAGKFEVTRRQYEQVMGGDGVKGADGQLPAAGVTWEKAHRFCQAVSGKAAGKWAVRLPTEAEWEWMARAGTATRYHTGDGLSKEVGLYDADSPRAVGGGLANAFGLHDVHGNVWEWCHDPAGEAGNDRPARGGSWNGGVQNCKSSARWVQPADAVKATVGFRVVADPVK